MQIEKKYRGVHLTLNFEIELDMSGQKHWRLTTVCADGSDENLWPLLPSDMWDELQSEAADEPFGDYEFTPEDEEQTA